MTNISLFIHSNNTGKQDELLIAMDMLNYRLSKIREYRLMNGYEYDQPTLADIEKTHVLFTRSTFKPFVLTTFEYQKRTAPGKISLGQEVQINITHFGDFFADQILRFDLSLTDVLGTTEVEGAQPLLRWCNYPGERIFDWIKFEVSSNEIDEYEPVDQVIYRNYYLPINKRKVYAKLMGQEVPEDGYFERNTLTSDQDGSLNRRIKTNVCNGLQTPKINYDTSVTLWVPLCFWYNLDFKHALPSISFPYTSRQIRFKLATASKLIGLVTRGTSKICDSKYLPDSAFTAWAGDDSGGSGLTLNKSNLTIENLTLYTNNLFVPPIIHDIYIERIGFNLIRVHKKQKINVLTSSEEHRLNQLKWPLETMFVSVQPKQYTETSDNPLARYLDRWDQHQYLVDQATIMSDPYLVGLDNIITNGVGGTATVSIAANGKDTLIAMDGVIISVLDFGTLGLEGKNITIVFNLDGVITVVNTTIMASPTVPNDFTNLTVCGVHAPAIYGNYAVADGDSLRVWGALAASNVSGNSLTVHNWEKTATLDSIEVSLHGIVAYESFDAKFFNTYVPWRYGGYNIQSPADEGLHMVNWALYPGAYQPSGYINVSRAREFYITVKSSWLGSTSDSDSSKKNEGVLMIICKAINFLLISDGSAILRYAT